MYHDILLTQYTKVHSLQAIENHFILYHIVYHIPSTQAVGRKHGS